ncbi:MAG TPA: hypothetical protein P5050_09740 [Bacteroidia bacterium]|nr:hypothetical protein [Bacteroidia bacterium]HRS59490.1 hypothetical protein [Bacteroidia bacterium]
MKKFTILSFYLFLIVRTIAQNAGSCVSFDGVDDYINCGNNSSVQITTNAVTMEAWIKASTWKTNVYEGTIVNKEGSSAGYMLRCGNGGELNMAIGNGSTWSQIYSGSTSTYMSLNQWYHVCGIYDGSTLKLYINGNQVASGTFSGNIGNTTNNLWIGSTQLYSSRTFKGNIDEVRIWKTAVSINTVKEYMFKPITSSHPNYSSLVAYYPMNEGTGTSIYDQSGNNNTGTLVNFTASSAWTGSYAPFASSPSVCLNNPGAVWPGVTIGTSAQMTVKDTLTGNSYLVFGHNNAPAGYNTTNKPSTIQKRLKRFWRLETEGSGLTGQIYFDYSGLDTSGFYTFRLLSDNDTNFSNATTIPGIKKGNYTIHFPNISFQDSTFYTIGAFDFQAPAVITQSIDEIKAYTAKVSGKVTEDGGLTTYRGICWSTSSNPDTSLSTKSLAGTGAGSYQVNITGLSSNTTYHVRAFAYNSLGLSYGADSSFTTKIPGLPTVLTDGYSTIYTDSILYRGKVVSDGNDLVTERGFVWSLNPNPTTALSTKLVKGSGTGSYTGMITGLTPGTTYHIRAYAINSQGTAYGADSTFSTLPVSVPTVTTGIISNITGYTALVGGNVSFDGRRPVTDKGICWSTSPNPTIILSTKTNEGGGTGTFTSTLTNLSPNTTYHVRAYATNSVGTAYGADSTFITAAPPTVVINQISGISYYSAVCSSTVVSDGRMPVTERGICYSTSPNPDINSATKIKSGSGTGLFSVPLSALNPNTIYHVRAYAINQVDTSYSADSSFKTWKTYPPTVNTVSVGNITDKSAYCEGNVSNDGGATVTARGFCWSTQANPTANLITSTINGNGLGNFSTTISGLSRGTTYHIRAYAINNVDTAYGGDSVFTTLDAPKVSTDNVSEITGTDAKCGGTVISTGGSPVIRRGVCWDNNPNPTARLSTKTTDGFGTGHFTSSIIFLSPGTKYYVRAYAINAIDTAYGNEVSFTTLSAPVVSTANVTSITGNSAVSGGTVSAGDMVTARGVVWSKYPNPTIALSTKTNDGTGLGTFVSNISGLEKNTTYHVRAYAINAAGTSFGNDISFKTATVPVVTTAGVTITSSSTAECGGNVVSDGGMTVTQRGVCWSTSPSPKVTGNKTTNGSGTGVFSSQLSGLNTNTGYYVRAYAINGVDTAYGEERSFIITPPTAKTGTASNVSTTTAEISGLGNAKGIYSNFTFEYGPDTGYGYSIAGNPSSASDTTEQLITAQLSGLIHNTVYHYRLVAESSHGKSYGADSTFKTLYDIGLNEQKTKERITIKYTDNELIIHVSDFSPAQVRISDLTGRIIANKNCSDGKMTFSLTQHNMLLLVVVVAGDDVKKEIIFSQ